MGFLRLLAIGLVSTNLYAVDPDAPTDYKFPLEQGTVQPIVDAAKQGSDADLGQGTSQVPYYIGVLQQAIDSAPGTAVIPTWAQPALDQLKASQTGQQQAQQSPPEQPPAGSHGGQQPPAPAPTPSQPGAQPAPPQAQQSPTPAQRQMDPIFDAQYGQLSSGDIASQLGTTHQGAYAENPAQTSRITELARLRTSPSPSDSEKERITQLEGEIAAFAQTQQLQTSDFVRARNTTAELLQNQSTYAASLELAKRERDAARAQFDLAQHKTVGERQDAETKLRAAEATLGRVQAVYDKSQALAQSLRPGGDLYRLAQTPAGEFLRDFLPRQTRQAATQTALPQYVQGEDGKPVTSLYSRGLGETVTWGRLSVQAASVWKSGDQEVVEFNYGPASSARRYAFVSTNGGPVEIKRVVNGQLVSLQP